jgi:hypothetical protein
MRGKRGVVIVLLVIPPVTASAALVHGTRPEKGQ